MSRFIIPLLLLFSINASFSYCTGETERASKAFEIIKNSNSPLQLREFLKKNTNANSHTRIRRGDRNEKCKNLLTWALIHRKHNMIEVLDEFNLIPLSRSETNEVGDKDRFSNYEYALRFGNKDLVAKMALNGGFVKHSMNGVLNSPIMFAINYNNLEAIKGILEVSDYNINKTNKYGWDALMLASHKGYSDIVDYLVSIGANLEGRSTSKWFQEFNFSSNEYEGANALMMAIYQNKEKEIFDTLISLESDLYLKNRKGQNSLMLASLSGNLYYIEKLLELGVNVNEVDKDGRSALMIASKNGGISVINKLIEAGADFNLKDNKGWTALMIAAQENKLNVVKRLVEVGINVNTISNDNEKLNALLLSGNNYDVLKELIKSGADINSTSGLGDTVLMRAVDNKVSNKVAIQIMDLGVDLHSTNNKGVNALMKAARKQRLDIVKELVHRGVDVNAKDEKGQNALFYDYGTKVNMDLIRFLVKSGIDVGAIDKKGETALGGIVLDSNQSLEAFLFFINSGGAANLSKTERDMLIKEAYYNFSRETNEDIILELIKLNQDIRFDDYLRVNTMGYFFGAPMTLLGVSIRFNHTKVAREVIGLGSNLDAYSYRGATLLMEAIIEGRNQIAMQLLDAGASLDLVSTGQGKTALMFAAEEGSFNLIEKIVKAGANLSITDKNGDTAYSIAVKNKRVKAIRDLLNPLGRGIN